MVTESEKQQAFMQRVKQHEKIIFKLVNLYASDEEEKQDLVQEILYQAWKGYERFQEKAAFSTWLYRLSLNTIFTAKRKDPGKRYPTGENSVEPSAPENMHASLEAKMLMQAIRALPELDRALISLHLDGYAHLEIAEMVGLTESNVRVKVHRIKKHLITTLNA